MQKNSSSLLAQLEESDSDDDLFPAPAALPETPSTAVATCGDFSDSDNPMPPVTKRHKRSREVEQDTDDKSQFIHAKKQKKNKKIKANVSYW